MAQFARPNADRTDGDWENESGDGTNLYDSINEITADDDTTYIRCDNSAANPCTVELETVTDPASSANHTIRYRYRKDAPQSLNLTIRLKQGATTIASKYESTMLQGSYTDGSFTLSTAEADAITDYSDLHIQFESNNRGVRVTWAEFECPDVAAPSDSVDGADLELPGHGRFHYGG